MMRRNEYLEWLCERLAPLGPIRAKAMFGGFGLYAGDLFFAIVADEVLYLKADALSVAEFEQAGVAPFTYPMKDGRLQSMRYYPVPDEAIDDDQAFLRWARKGLEAALRAPRKAAKPRRGRQ